MAQDQMRRGDKSKVIERILLEKSHFSVHEACDAFEAETGETISRPMVYRVKRELGEKIAENPTESPITTEELRKMRDFIASIGSIARVKRLLAEAEELLGDIPR